MALDQVEVSVKDLQVPLGDTNFKQINHEDELTLIFDKFYVFQEGVVQNIRTVTEIVDKIEASALIGLIYQGSNQPEALMEQISELEKDSISDRLRIHGLESRLNEGADELAVGEVIVR